MKNTMKKVVCATFAAMTLSAALTMPSTAAKKPVDPIAIISTQEFDANWEKLDSNITWCECATCKVVDKQGNGKNVVNGYYVNLKHDRYKGKKLPKGAKVTCYFWYSPNKEDVEMRADYYKGKRVYFSGYTTQP